jgi:hypothetical protein
MTMSYDVSTAGEFHPDIKAEIARMEQEIKDEEQGGKQMHFDFYSRRYMGIMTEAEVAKLFNVDELTIGRWRRDGKGPPFIRPGKEVFYRENDVRTWMMDIAEWPKDPRDPNEPKVEPAKEAA